MQKRQAGLFDEDERLARISKLGDPLERLRTSVQWDLFAPILNQALHKEPNGPGGCPPYDYLMMFKILILQEYFGLSDEQVECYPEDTIGAVEWFFDRLQVFDNLTHGSIESVTTDYKSSWIEVIKTHWEGHCSSCQEQSTNKFNIPYSVFFSTKSLEEWLKERKQEEEKIAIKESLKKQAQALKDAEELAEKQRVAKEAAEYATYLKVKKQIEVAQSDNSN